MFGSKFRSLEMVSVWKQWKRQAQHECLWCSLFLNKPSTNATEPHPSFDTLPNWFECHYIFPHYARCYEGCDDLVNVFGTS